MFRRPPFQEEKKTEFRIICAEWGEKIQDMSIRPGNQRNDKLAGRETEVLVYLPIIIPGNSIGPNMSRKARELIGLR
jgi:hypothetical protein